MTLVSRSSEGNGSTLGLYNPHQRSIRVQNWGFYVLDPPRALGAQLLPSVCEKHHRFGPGLPSNVGSQKFLETERARDVEGPLEKQLSLAPAVHELLSRFRVHPKDMEPKERLEFRPEYVLCVEPNVHPSYGPRIPNMDSASDIAPKDRLNTRILQTLVSGVSLIVGLGTRM